MTLLLATGLVHGIWTERWQPSEALEQAAARVGRLPLDIGDWQGSDVTVDPEAFTQAGARGYWARSYSRRDGGGSVLVILMCGRAGRMAVHTPEVCYRGAGYDLLETATRTVARDEAGIELGSFWSARFSKQSGTANDLRLSWAWGEGNGWQASTNPRWDFRGQPFLYKLYASHELATAESPDLTAEFLRQFLPVLKEVLTEP
jgi:hypothetical protein